MVVPQNSKSVQYSTIVSQSECNQIVENVKFKFNLRKINIIGFEKQVLILAFETILARKVEFRLFYKCL